MVFPSGEQFEIVSGSHKAVIVEVGGGVREYTVSGRPVLFGYPAEEMATGARNTPLIPWPNRLEDGRYTFDGKTYQVALTEPEKQNAIHGFLRWRPWRCAEKHPDRVVMTARIHPMMGYPFTLDVHVEYALSEAGLVCTTTAKNLGDATLPFAAGQHPYLTAGTERIDPCTLELDGTTWVPTDDARQLPTGPKPPVEGTPYDFRKGKVIGTQEVDYAFGDLTRDGEGKAWARLIAPDGHKSELWADSAYKYLEIYTAHTLPESQRRRGCGVEPMTCAPNGFRSGDGLIRLEPGQSWTGRWGVRSS